MTRKKVTLAYITNDSERRASFKKRKRGLIKKVSELSTLCGVDACAIIYSQFDAEPEVWPSVLGAQAVLARFRKMSTMDQTRKMVNQESFTRQRIKKVDDQLRRLRKDNKRKEMERFLYMNLLGCGDLNHFNLADAADLAFVINQTLRDIKAQMENLKKNEQQQEAVVAPPPPLPEVSMGMTFAFPAVQEEPAPLMNPEELEGFPWSLVQSPAFGGLDDGLGWDDGMMLPYPYFFDNNNGAGPSGTKPAGNNF